MANEVQNDISKVSTDVTKGVATLKTDVSGIEAKIDKPITVKLWVAVVAVLAALIIGHLV